MSKFITLDDGDSINVHSDGSTVLIGHNRGFHISSGCTVEPLTDNENAHIKEQQVMYRRIVQLNQLN